MDFMAKKLKKKTCFGIQPFIYLNSFKTILGQRIPGMTFTPKKPNLFPHQKTKGKYSLGR
jgi:hypothetical protein